MPAAPTSPIPSVTLTSASQSDSSCPSRRRTAPRRAGASPRLDKETARVTRLGGGKVVESFKLERSLKFPYLGLMGRVGKHHCILFTQPKLTLKTRAHITPEEA